MKRGRSSSSSGGSGSGSGGAALQVPVVLDGAVGKVRATNPFAVPLSLSYTSPSAFLPPDSLPSSTTPSEGGAAGSAMGSVLSMDLEQAAAFFDQFP